jgi:nitroimidazol reductase NimA-like FMN-containing flavoprotein (pyridoxamine 5'-phosphate oxidase superfamily)
MFGKLDEDEIEILLNKQVIGRIGCHADNTTYVVPVSFGYDGQFIYGYTQEGMKINMMRKNPEVCFEVDEVVDTYTWRSVICMGEFEELEDGEERTEALKILLRRPLPAVTSQRMQFSSEQSAPNLNIIRGLVYRILIKSKTGRFESNALA